MNIAFEPLFAPFVSSVIERLRFLHPNYSFAVDGAAITVTGGSDEDQAGLRKEVAFQLYREKIYQEGLPMRTAMYEALLK